MQDDGERLLRFHVLYSAVLKQEFDRDEFLVDDLYAFQAFERALRSDNQELRNLAAHLQAARQSAMETITLKSTEPLEATRRMPSLSSMSGAAPVARPEPVPEAPAQAAPEPSPAAEAPVSSAESPADAASLAPRTERRSGAHRLSPQDVTRVTYFQRLYREEFGKPLNVTRFTMDDAYGREILKESLSSRNQELVAVARHFVDEQGEALHHRRNSPSRPA